MDSFPRFHSLHIVGWQSPTAHIGDGEVALEVWFRTPVSDRDILTFKGALMQTSRTWEQLPFVRSSDVAVRIWVPAPQFRIRLFDLTEALPVVNALAGTIQQQNEAAYADLLQLTREADLALKERLNDAGDDTGSHT